MEFIEAIFVVLAYIAVLGFLVNGLDDLFFDSHFIRYLFRRRRQPSIKLDDLKGAPEQWVAIFVPAWKEGGIVNKMADYAARVLLYEKYDIFIGVYPNDAETMRCVDEVCSRYPRIHKVVVPHKGPTNKADCLNWIHRAMRLNERSGVKEYRIVAIHDAEDVLHPLVLKVYNYFVPRDYDMAQLPVFALEHPVWRYWSANTYIDDFSELHTKDLFVREAIGGIVPSAGVGTCFTREVLDQLCSRADSDPFLLGNLTEDYEIGIRIKRMGFRTGIISYPVDRIVRKRKRNGSLGKPETVSEVVAVREHFPSTFWTAVQQRTRWILGISFQTWEQAGWAGSLPMRYTLLRDRRAPLTHLLNMAGYLTLIYVLVQWLFGFTPWAGYFFIKPLFASGSILWNLVIIDTCLLAYRAAQKFVSVYDVYGLKQAIFSLPRTVVGNFINFVATLRAFRLYAASKLFNKPLVWHKTSHVFPDADELSEYSKSVEDLLVERGMVTREQIFQAIKSEQRGTAPTCLLRMGLIDEAQFSEAWKQHSGLPLIHLNPDRIQSEFLKEYSESLSLRWGAIPIEKRGEELAVAFAEPPSPDRLKEVGDHFQSAIKPVLVRPSTLALARDRAYPRLVLPGQPVSELYQALQVASGLGDAAFYELLALEQKSGLSLAEILVERGSLLEPVALGIWANTLGCAPRGEGIMHLEQELYYTVGPAFWWLHRMLPVGPREILTAVPPHPRLVRMLEDHVGGSLTFLAELPDRFQALMRDLAIDLDPDKALVDHLTGKDLLSPANAKTLHSSRSVIKDPLPRWILQQGLVSEKNLEKCFLEISYLPLAKPWKPEAVQFSKPVLPTKLSVDHKCYCLDVDEGLLLGIGQLPSSDVLQRLFHRLVGQPICFEALSREDVRSLEKLMKETHGLRSTVR